MNSNNHTADLGVLLDRLFFKAIIFKDDVAEAIENLFGESHLHLAESGIEILYASAPDSPYFTTIVSNLGTDELMILGYNSHNKSIDAIFGTLTHTHYEIIEECIDVPRSNVHELLKKFTKMDIKPPGKEQATA